MRKTWIAYILTGAIAVAGTAVLTQSVRAAQNKDIVASVEDSYGSETETQAEESTQSGIESTEIKNAVKSTVNGTETGNQDGSEVPIEYNTESAEEPESKESTQDNLDIFDYQLEIYDDMIRTSLGTQTGEFGSYVTSTDDGWLYDLRYEVTDGDTYNDGENYLNPEVYISELAEAANKDEKEYVEDQWDCAVTSAIKEIKEQYGVQTEKKNALKDGREFIVVKHKNQYWIVGSIIKERKGYIFVYDIKEKKCMTLIETSTDNINIGINGIEIPYNRAWDKD